mmetsp:Transcript_42670/g.66831  ORF Transcript_42670/g.66831 Transcript_42670/m.66831 type:complete len:283 (-) Transcript_42670:1586-2434(-)
MGPAHIVAQESKADVYPEVLNSLAKLMPQDEEGDSPLQRGDSTLIQAHRDHLLLDQTLCGDRSCKLLEILAVILLTNARHFQTFSLGSAEANGMLGVCVVGTSKDSHPLPKVLHLVLQDSSLPAKVGILLKQFCRTLVFDCLEVPAIPFGHQILTEVVLAVPLQYNVVLGQWQLEVIVPNRQGLASAAQILDGGGLVHREAYSIFRRCQGKESAIGPATSQKRAADHSVGHTMNQVVSRVATEDSEPRGGIGAGKEFAHKRLGTLRNPRNITNDQSTACHPV